MRDLWGLPPDHDPALDDTAFLRYLRLLGGHHADDEPASVPETHAAKTTPAQETGPVTGPLPESRQRMARERSDASHRQPDASPLDRLMSRASRLGLWRPGSRAGLWPLAVVAAAAISVIALTAFWAGEQRVAVGAPATAGAVAPRVQDVASSNLLLPTASPVSGLPNGSPSAATAATSPGAASSRPPAIAPPSVLTGDNIRAWFDAAQKETLLASPDCSGGPATTTVGCWLDRASGARATQPNESMRPRLTPTTDGISVPYFTGTGGGLAFNPAGLPTGDVASTIFVVAKLGDTDPSAAGWQLAFSYGGGDARTARTIGKLDKSAQVFADTRYDGRVSPPRGEWSTARASLVETELASGGIRMALDGSPFGQRVKVAFETADTIGVIGGNSASAGGSPWLGSIQEIIVLAGTVSASERAQIQDYLAMKWSIPLT